MFNQSKVVPTVLSTTPKMYIYPTKSQKSPLFTFQPILWRHSRFFPYLAEIGLEPRVKRHMMNMLSPDRKQSKVYAAAASYKTHIHTYIYIYIYIYTLRQTYVTSLGILLLSDDIHETSCFDCLKLAKLKP